MAEKAEDILICVLMLNTGGWMYEYLILKRIDKLKKNSHQILCKNRKWTLNMRCWSRGSIFNPGSLENMYDDIYTKCYMLPLAIFTTLLKFIVQKACSVWTETDKLKLNVKG